MWLLNLEPPINEQVCKLGTLGLLEAGCPHKCMAGAPITLSLMADMGLVTWQECSSWNDTVCRCSPGYFCETQEGDHCSLCLPHATCPPGQRVQSRGELSNYRWFL